MRRERARSLINSEVDKIIDGPISQWIVRLTGQWLVRWEVFYLTGKEFSINTHPSNQPKEHLGHNQYQTPVNLFVTVFRLITQVQASHPLTYLSNYWVKPFPQNLYYQKIHLFLKAVIWSTLGGSCQTSMPHSKLRRMEAQTYQQLYEIMLPRSLCRICWENNSITSLARIFSS